MKRMHALLIVLAFAAVAGCYGGVKEKTIEVSPNNDPLYEPRQILKSYSEGQALGNEVSSYPTLVAKVREVDPTRADILEKGFADIQKASAADRPARAKEVLKKLEPQMKVSSQ